MYKCYKEIYKVHVCQKSSKLSKDWQGYYKNNSGAVFFAQHGSMFIIISRWCPTRGHSGDEAFQATDCNSIDNHTLDNHEKYAQKN